MIYELRVRLFANLKEVAGSSIITLKFDSAPTVKEVLNALFLMVPDLEKYLIKNGTLNERYRILVDSEELPRDRFTSPLRAREISILPPVSGG